MATLKDVAKKAGVSIATVSYLINGTRHVSEDLQKRIYDAIEELDYRPNDVARSLRSSSSKLVGIVVSNLDSEFYTEVVETAEHILYLAGYSTIICNSGLDLEKEEKYINMLLSKVLGGLIIAPAPSSAPRQVLNKNFPIVVINRDYFDYSGSAIMIDNRSKSRECVEHLIQVHQYTDIALVARWDISQNESARIQGYKEVMAEHGLTSRIYMASEFAGGAADIVSKWVHEHSLPRACFIAGTSSYLGILQGFKKYGIKVPEDVALIGFSDSKYNSVLTPPLSAVKNPGHRIGEMAANELLDIMRTGNHPKKQIIVDVDVDYRASCGCKFQEEAE